MTSKNKTQTKRRAYAACGKAEKANFLIAGLVGFGFMAAGEEKEERKAFRRKRSADAKSKRTHFKEKGRSKSCKQRKSGGRSPPISRKSSRLRMWGAEEAKIKERSSVALPDAREGAEMVNLSGRYRGGEDK